MAPVFVAGTINIETTLQVDSFPIEYSPVRYPFFGVHSAISGVGYNIAKALTVLGNPVLFLSIVGQDHSGRLVHSELEALGLSQEFILPLLLQTPQSVILYEGSGKRQINVDLKDLQEREFPTEKFRQALEGCDLAVIGNINFTRPFLQVAIEAGIPVATDVHAIANLDDDYNRDYMASAQVLFQSDEWLPCSPEDWVRQLFNRYGVEVAVVGMGARGALLGVRSDHSLHRFPAVYTRPVVSTIGAGDALFSAFIHTYHHKRDPYQAMQKAMLFASYKIGVASASEGFLTGAELDELYSQAHLPL